MARLPALDLFGLRRARQLDEIIPPITPYEPPASPPDPDSPEASYSPDDKETEAVLERLEYADLGATLAERIELAQGSVLATVRGEGEAAAIRRISDELGLDVDTVAERWAAGKALQKEWDEFVERHRLRKRRSLTDWLNAGHRETALDALQRRRRGLELRASSENLPQRSRELIEFKLRELDDLERRLWSTLYPPTTYSDVFEGDGWTAPPDRDALAYECRYCGGPMSRAERYEVGRCSRCQESQRLAAAARERQEGAFK